MGWVRLGLLALTAACLVGAVPVLIEESVYGQGGHAVRKSIRDEGASAELAPVALPQVALGPEGGVDRLGEEEREAGYGGEGDAPGTTEPQLALGGYADNKLYNDYPPKEELDKSFRFEVESNPEGYPMQPVFRPVPHPSLPAPHPMYPMIYRGYPYMYGYPLDFRYGYAYGHAFGTDDNFVCPSDGRFYRDFGSFFNCDGGQFTVQFCAPGSKNAPPGRLLGPSVFCNVNLVGGKRPLLLPH